MSLVRSAREAHAAGQSRPSAAGQSRPSAAGLAAAGCILAVALAGCTVAQPGPAAGPATGAASPASIVQAASVPPAAMAGTAPMVMPTPTPTVVLPPKPCLNSGLAVAPGSRSTHDGSQSVTFVLTNSGPQPCTIGGAPQVTPQGPLSGQNSAMEANLAVSQQDLSLPPGADAGPSTGILLQPGQKADFDLNWYSSSSVVCENSNGFGFDVPGDSAHTGARLVAYPFGQMCDGLFYVSRVYTPQLAG